MIYIFVLLIGLAAGNLSGVIGTGSTIILLPILVRGTLGRAIVERMSVRTFNSALDVLLLCSGRLSSSTH